MKTNLLMEQQTTSSKDDINKPLMGVKSSRKTKNESISADDLTQTPDETAKIESHLFEINETADNLNNLMALVIGNISLAKMELSAESAAEKYLSEAVSACIQTKPLTSRLVQISEETDSCSKHSIRSSALPKGLKLCPP
jgi:hypothetical protein